MVLSNTWEWKMLTLTLLNTLWGQQALKTQHLSQLTGGGCFLWRKWIKYIKTPLGWLSSQYFLFGFCDIKNVICLLFPGAEWMMSAIFSLHIWKYYKNWAKASLQRDWWELLQVKISEKQWVMVLILILLAFPVLQLRCFPSLAN